MYRTDIGSFDGRSWEELIQRCLKDKYELELYQVMPDTVNGDGGIEGFTLKTGKVFQVYCPDSQYDVQELYEHQRDKITRDLKKLIDNQKQIMSAMGNKKIKEWHLITPEYTNKLLNSHCRKKEQEYREKNLSHIDAEFTVLVKDYRDFICEITRHSSLMNLKLEISLDLPFEPNWEECTSSHTGNLRRKIRNLFISYYEHIDEDTIKEKVDKVVGKYIFYYQRGLKVLNNLEDRYPEQYEKFKSIKSSQGENVEMECMFPPKSKKELLDKIQDNLLNELKDELGSVFGNSSLEQLSKQIVAEWLMICPLDFGGE